MDYSTIQSNKILRQYAREQLQGVWGKMAFAFFILFLIYLPHTIISNLGSLLETQISFLQDLSYFVASALAELYTSIPGFPSIAIISLILTIAVFTVSGPFDLGLAGYFLKRVRGEEIFTKNIFDGFKQFPRSFLLMLLICIFIFLWTLLLIIPGVIKSFSYSMAFYIMYDNPEIKASEALEKSKIMMNGYKWKLLLLSLSFIGWGILSLLTLGIGFFWLRPYVGLTIANFYENLKINQGAQETVDH